MKFALLSAFGVALAWTALGAESQRVVSNVPFLETGRAEKLDLYLPARAETDPPVPGVVWIHGGGWTGGDKAGGREKAVCAVLVQAGYVCASVNYRLGDGAWPGNLLDCKNAVRFLRAHAAEYHVDPSRIAVMGGSAGAHLALMVGLTGDEPALEPTAPYPNVTDEVSAIGDFYGMADFLSPQQVGPARQPLATPSDQAVRVFGRSLSADPALWKLASPVSHIGADSPPVFIAHGLIDPMVDFRQSEALDQALSAKGVAHRLVLLEGIGHTFDLTRWNHKPMPHDLRPDLLQFMAQYLGVAAHGLPVSPAVPTPRRELNLNAGWKFFARDHRSGSEVSLDESNWENINLPHTWNAKDGQDGGGNYHRGPAWYRRHLAIDGGMLGKRLYLQFDGAAFQADVYVNGKKIGSHLGGFARFRFDATEALQAGDNVLAVRVDNSPAGIPPTSADFTFFGGLYRSVSLIATEPVQIAMMDYGSPGVFIDQTAVSQQRADITVRTAVENYEDKKHSVEVVTVVFDSAGHAVAHSVAKGKIAGGDGFSSVQKISLSHPHLWNGRADPYLYSVLVTIRADGVVRDAVAQPLGLRYFRVDPNQGFMLNGRPLDLHGVNRHQDRIDKGWAIAGADEAEDFALLQELGCTAVRVSHYQQSDTWYQRLDRAGIVAWAEIPFVNEALPAPSFLASANDQLRELIRQNYNHPSICFWGVGNETRDLPLAPPPQPAKGAKPLVPPPRMAGGPVSDHVVAELALLAKSEDRTRLSTYAANGKENEPKNWHTDVVAFNHYAGWYSGEVAGLAGYLDTLHAKHPSNAIGVSEYGAGASIFQHQLPAPRPETKSKLHPEEYQAELHEASWAVLAARPYLWGKFVWCLFDFASDGRSEGYEPGRNDKGLVTYDRQVRKDAYYFYKANWSSEPVVNLDSRRFLVRHRPETDIKVYSNAAQVELLVNGHSLGTQSSAAHVFIWKHQPLREGENSVAAKAHFGPLEVTDGCTWLFEPK
jgi:beta-galactosidase